MMSRVYVHFGAIFNQSAQTGITFSGSFYLDLFLAKQILTTNSNVCSAEKSG